jgi:hypothetical protein
MFPHDKSTTILHVCHLLLVPVHEIPSVKTTLKIKLMAVSETREKSPVDHRTGNFSKHPVLMKGCQTPHHLIVKQCEILTRQQGWLHFKVTSPAQSYQRRAGGLAAISNTAYGLKGGMFSYEGFILV